MPNAATPKILLSVQFYFAPKPELIQDKKLNVCMKCACVLHVHRYGVNCNGAITITNGTHPISCVRHVLYVEFPSRRMQLKHLLFELHLTYKRNWTYKTGLNGMLLTNIIRQRH